MDHQKYKEKYTHDYTAAVAIAFQMANLLFIGVFYVFLWGLYFLSYKNASQVSKNHLKQALWVSTITTTIAATLAIIAYFTTGFASVQALIMAEVYLMVIVPIFMFFSVMGFAKAINENDYKFPIIGKLVGVNE